MEDTEWNDVLREKGILPPKPKEAEISEEAILAMMDQVIHEKTHGKALEDCNLDELDELEDLEDDRVLESYRRQRLADIQAQLSREVFGRVIQISKPDYTTEITNASKDHWVILHLYQDYVPGCKLINAILDRLAAKYRATKFCKSIANMCVEGYPDKNCPTFLIYHQGDLARQIIGIQALGGVNTTVEKVEQILASIGAIEVSDERRGSRDDDSEDERGNTKPSGIRVMNKSSRNDDDDEDWD